MTSTLSLADSLQQLPGRTAVRGPRCTVGQVLDSLETADPAGHRALVDALGRDDVPAAGLAAALAEHGHPVKAHTVRRHRGRAGSSGCACPA